MQSGNNAMEMIHSRCCQVEGGRKEMTVVFTLQNRRLSSSVASARCVLGWQAQGGCAKQLSAPTTDRSGGLVDWLSARGETVASGMSEVK
jgi:hypothetical protein